MWDEYTNMMIQKRVFLVLRKALVLRLTYSSRDMNIVTIPFPLDLCRSEYNFLRSHPSNIQEENPSGNWAEDIPLGWTHSYGSMVPWLDLYEGEGVIL